MQTVPYSTMNSGMETSLAGRPARKGSFMRTEGRASIYRKKDGRESATSTPDAMVMTHDERKALFDAGAGGATMRSKVEDEP